MTPKELQEVVAKEAPGKLGKLLLKGPLDALLSVFEGMPETDRRKHAKGLLAIETCCNQFDLDLRDADSKKQWRERGIVEGRVRHALFATASLSEMKKVGWRLHPRWDDEIEQVMADRRAPWLGDWAEWLIAQNPRFFGDVQPLVRRGLCAAPTHDHYVLGLVSIAVGSRPGDPSLKEALIRDPDLFDDLFWKLFSVPGFQEHSPASYDKFAKSGALTWSATILALENEGRLPRQRLLDESLAALSRDFNAFQSRWFQNLHDLLGPDQDEQAARLDDYLALTRSPVGSNVAYALKVLTGLWKKERVPGEALLAALEPVVSHPVKGHAKKALKLAASLAKKQPTLAPAVADLAVPALESEAADVQAEAIAILEAYGRPGDEALAARVSESAPLVSAIHAPRLADWLGAGAPSVAASESGVSNEVADLLQQAKALPVGLAGLSGVAAAAAAFEQATEEVPRIEIDLFSAPHIFESKRLPSIGDLEELVDVGLAALEDPEDLPQLERLFDGVARLHAQRPEDFGRRVAPLAHRLDRFLQALSETAWPGEPDLSLAMVLAAWLGKAGPRVAKDRKGEPLLWLKHRVWNSADPTDATTKDVPYYLDHLLLDAVFALRSEELRQQIERGEVGTLLSPPSHQSGWVAAEALVARALARVSAGGAPGTADLIIALQRLAPDGRADALAQAESLPDEWGAAIRYALGGGETIGQTLPL